MITTSACERMVRCFQLPAGESEVFWLLEFCEAVVCGTHTPRHQVPPTPSQPWEDSWPASDQMELDPVLREDALASLGSQPWQASWQAQILTKVVEADLHTLFLRFCHTRHVVDVFLKRLLEWLVIQFRLQFVVKNLLHFDIVIPQFFSGDEGTGHLQLLLSSSSSRWSFFRGVFSNI